MTKKITKFVVAVAFTLAIAFGTVAFVEEVGDPIVSSSSVEAVATFQPGHSGGGC